jgi:hypothetical protein
MWAAIKAVFFTVIVVLAFLMAPIFGAIMTAGFIFYVVYETVRQYDEIKERKR